MHPRDLVSHRCVSFTGVSQPLEWMFYDNHSRIPVKLQPRLIVNLAPAAISAAQDGVGITQLLSYQAATEVSCGNLVPILRAYEPESTPVNLLHVERRGTSGKIRSFVEFVTETLRNTPHLQCESGVTTEGECTRRRNNREREAHSEAHAQYLQPLIHSIGN